MKRIQLLFTMIIISLHLHAQASDSARQKVHHREQFISLLTGFSQGRYSFIDIGVSLNSYRSDGYHPFSSAIYISNEIKLANKLLIGPKLGTWICGGSSAIAMGLNMVYYTNFKNASLVFRPEIGAGMDKFKIVYGYNLRFTNRSFNWINKNLVGFTYCFDIRKLKKTSAAVY